MRSKHAEALGLGQRNRANLPAKITCDRLMQQTPRTGLRLPVSLTIPGSRPNRSWPAGCWKRAAAAGTPFGWVTGEAYGQDPALRGWRPPPQRLDRRPATLATTQRAKPLKRGRTACGQRRDPSRTNTTITSQNGQPPDELTPLTVNEIRRLHATMTQQQPSPDFVLQWSRWRRRHQARARRCHYQRRRERRN
jgi:hypothetical protein